MSITTKYLKDHSTDTLFYPITHKNAVVGLDVELEGKLDVLTAGLNITIVSTATGTTISATGGGSELILSDWNLTDDTKKDYIKNKPTIPIVPTTLSSFTDDLGSSPTHTHSLYLTTETDPIFTASAAHNITSTDISNWNGKLSPQTTLSGYGITDAYTKTEIDEAHSVIIETLDGLINVTLSEVINVLNS